MRIRIAAAAIALVAAVATFHASAQHTPTPPPASRSVKDGVYTEEQAKRGERVYGQECSHCHGPALDGGEAAPLIGSAFATNWNRSTLDELFDKIKTTMPQDDPGRLNGQQAADVLAYILNVNHSPAGKTELAPDKELLKLIRFELPTSP